VKRDPQMREAALEMIRRMHEETGAPMVCQDPAVYAAVARLLRDEGDPNPRRVEAVAASNGRTVDLGAGDHRPDQLPLPHGPATPPRLGDALPRVQVRDGARAAASRQLGLKGRYGRRVLLLDRKQLGAR
jgi:hypothetical protein